MRSVRVSVCLRDSPHTALAQVGVGIEAMADAFPRLVGLPSTRRTGAIPFAQGQSALHEERLARALP